MLVSTILLAAVGLVAASVATASAASVRQRSAATVNAVKLLTKPAYLKGPAVHWGKFK